MTFEVGIQSMGGAVIFLDHTQARLGERECRFATWRGTSNAGCKGIVARVYEQRVSGGTGRERRHSSDQRAFGQIPSLPGAGRFSPRRKVRLACADSSWPTSATATTYAIRLICRRAAGVHMRIATPAGYAPDAEIVAEAKRVARETRAKIEIVHARLKRR